MSPLSPVNPDTSQMNDPPAINAAVAHIVAVPRIDRWRIYHRLQELTIPCWCLPDGSLRVEVQNGMGALLLRSVVQQFVASRQEIVSWLERCWDAELS
ncbi:MAG: Asr1405/Asl0597 family protein [Kovacikia sp.]